MRSFWPIFKRELFAFFVTPLAWVLMTVFLLVQGMHFFLLVDHFSNLGQGASDQTPLQAFFGNTVLLYLVMFLLVPPMTMRLFAEERRSGTIEGLMTAPVSSAGVVLAKYVAVLFSYTVMWAPTALYLVILRRTGELDWHVAASAYLGVFLVGAGYLALGMLMSVITKSQFLALVLTALLILALFILGVGEFVARDGTLWHDICSHVSVWAHMNDFASGIVDSRRLVFYGSIVLVCIFVSMRAIDAWRWSMDVKLTWPLKLRVDREQLSQVLGVVIAVVVVVLTNVASYRRYTRWDWTANKRYSLSPATVQTLHELPETIQIWVLLGGADPLEQSVKQLLVAYKAETTKLDVHYVDPDRDTAAIEDLRKRFKIETGRTDQGHVVADAIVVVARRDKHWFLTTSDMVEVAGADDTRVKPREERALTGAIRNVLGSQKVKLCFTLGHGEMSPADVGERGVGLLRDVLEKDNFEIGVVDSSAPGNATPFMGCEVVVVAGLRGAIGKDEAERLRTYLLDGGNMLLAVSPVTGQSQTGLIPPGLERVLGPFGIGLDEALVIEEDGDLAFPNEQGLTSVVIPRQHAITAALVKGDSNRDVPRVVVKFARSMHRVTEPGSASPQDLLLTSDKAFGLTSLVGAADHRPVKKPGDLNGPLVVAMASERPKLTPSAPHGPRLVVLGSPTPLTTPAFREPFAMRGAALFVESSISWLASKPQVLDVPDRGPVAAGMRITSDDRDEIRRYVLMFMPATLALLGLGLGLWRRGTEGKAAKKKDAGRESTAKPKKKPKKARRAAE